MTPDIVGKKRDYDLIEKAGKMAKEAADNRDISLLGKAVLTSYKVQLGEGMKELPNMKGAIAKKYLGGGHGGYALYIFKEKKDRDAALKANLVTKEIEPYIDPAW